MKLLSYENYAVSMQGCTDRIHYYYYDVGESDMFVEDLIYYERFTAEYLEIEFGKYDGTDWIGMYQSTIPLK